MTPISPEFLELFGLSFFTTIVIILTCGLLLAKYYLDFDEPTTNFMYQHIVGDTYKPIQQKKPFKILHKEPYEMKMLSPLHIDV